MNNMTGTIGNKFTLEDFQKAMKTIKDLPPIALEMQVYPQGYLFIKENIKCLNDFRNDELHNRNIVSNKTGYSGHFNGINIVVIYSDDELKFNQGKIIYNNGSSKIIDIFQVKDLRFEIN